ncbi:hypothetical protein ACQPXH_27335 [Nocardia sp. CA-135953]|uniref:hypothetical protein n=1 Tax=Nocardia sp. CA-135953 TaxID=3239978 RepID=UPI003D988477
MPRPGLRIQVLDSGSAAETVCQDQGSGLALADGRHEFVFGAGYRDVVSRHSAATHSGARHTR